MQALHLIYQHWFITCILLVFAAISLYGVALAVVGFTLKIRSGK